MKHLKFLFHLTGTSTMVAASILLVIVFFSIQTQGSFIGIENNLLIRYSEFILSGFSVFYSLYLVVKFVRVTSYDKKGES